MLFNRTPILNIKMIFEDNLSDSDAQFLTKQIKESLYSGDLKTATRRSNRVIKDFINNKNIDKQILGELIIAASETLRAAGKNDKAVELILTVLHGNGGISIEILGRAKRLRARLLLDEEKIDEAEVLAGTADRYIVIGLMEESVQQASGREIKVNVQVDQKVLDSGQYVSVETYLLLAEIAAIQNDWQKVVWNIKKAQEKGVDERDTGTALSLNLWNGIIKMAAGESFIETSERALGLKPPAELIGRIQSLLGEYRPDDCIIGEAEFRRFYEIGLSARRLPLKYFSPDETEVSTVSNFDSDISNYDSGNVQLGGKVIEIDLRTLSFMRLVEIAEIEKVTGSIIINWNIEAVREGIKTGLLHESVKCGAGVIQCRDGKFIDAKINSDTDDLPVFENGDSQELSKFCLKQILLIVIGGGSEILTRMQNGEEINDDDGQSLPEVFGVIKRSKDSENIEDSLKIGSNLNFFLNVSKFLDESRYGIQIEDENEIEWEKAWEPTVNSQSDKNFISSPDISFDSRDENSIDKTFVIEGDGEIDTLFENIIDTTNENTEKVEPDSEKITFDNFAEKTEVLAPWTSETSVSEENENKFSSRRNIPLHQLIELSEIDLLLSSPSWNELTLRLADIMQKRFYCFVCVELRYNVEILTKFESSPEDISAKKNEDLLKQDFRIINDFSLITGFDKLLDQEEQRFLESLIGFVKLKILDTDFSFPEQQNFGIGGIEIADDEWLKDFMVPPQSLAMRKKLNDLKSYAGQDGFKLPKAHILLTGETGVGKDVFAGMIHKLSGRSDKPFVRADMGAVGSGDQFIATLFGAVKGAYTGMAGARRGLVEEAAGGTLFLNEIGNLSLDDQRTLLDFMQEGFYTKLGDTSLQKTDVRIILATNENVHNSERFRQDVKYRCAPPIQIPSLRDRREDIAALAAYFAGPNVNLKEAAVRLLELQHWSGNVRELSQVIQSAVAKIGGSGSLDVGTVDDVLKSINGSEHSHTLNFPVPPADITYAEALQRYEKFLLEYSLSATKNKKSDAAKLWGESPASISKKTKKWNIDE